MFAFRSQVGRVDVAFTDRHGGTSAAPFASLNVGYGSGDDADAVAANFAAVAASLGTDSTNVVTLRQLHGADVVHVRTAGEPVRAADALVTSVPGLTLCVRAADCVPVLLADVDRGVIGAAHAGRSGMAAGVVPAAVMAMRRLGARHLAAWVGPHICGRCYEVPAALCDEVGRLVPSAYATTSWGTPALDLGAGVRAQLLAQDCEVAEVGACTFEATDLFSYRREGARSGRQAGFISMTS